MTNRERINSMTDEEFADWFAKTGMCACCAYRRVDMLCYEACEEGMDIWLKQEYKEAQDEKRGQDD